MTAPLEAKVRYKTGWSPSTMPAQTAPPVIIPTICPGQRLDLCGSTSVPVLLTCMSSPMSLFDLVRLSTFLDKCWRTIAPGRQLFEMGVGDQDGRPTVSAGISPRQRMHVTRGSDGPRPRFGGLLCYSAVVG